MKQYLLLISIFYSSFCFAQKRFVLSTDSIKIVYILKEDSSNVFEDIQIQNFSYESIYIPDVKNRDIYFFALNYSLYSNFGVMNSILGTPNLSQEVAMIKIGSKQNMNFSINIQKKNKDIRNYFFSADYITEYDMNRADVHNGLKIGLDKYVNVSKHLIGSIEYL